MQIAPMNPWLHMYYATTGRNARGEIRSDLTIVGGRIVHSSGRIR